MTKKIFLFTLALYLIFSDLAFGSAESESEDANSMVA